MEWSLALAIIGVSFITLLILGVPIGAAMGIVGAVFMVASGGVGVGLQAIGLLELKALVSYDLLAITFYVLIAEIMLAGGLADDLYDVASKWLNWVPGGLAVVAIGVGTIFATVSGSSVASISAIGKTSIPQMLERGYSKRLAVGAVGAAGGLAHLIPPSIVMVIYASFCELPVGWMLMAGVFPGLILAALYGAAAVIWGLGWPSSAPREAVVSWRERLVVLKKLVDSLLIVFAVLGTMMLGVATITEASVLGAIMAIILVIARRKSSWHLFGEASRETAVTSSFIVLMIVGAKLFSWVLNYTTAPQHIVQYVASLPVSPIQLIIIFQVLYFILGMFLDTLGQIFITMPVILPILYNLGFDPIWFGILFFVNVEMGMITPPYGSSLYVLKGISPPQVTLGDIVYGSIPFFLGDIATIAIVMVFPSLALWLPNALFAS